MMRCTISYPESLSQRPSSVAASLSPSVENVVALTLTRPGIYNLKHQHRIPIPRGAVYCGRGGRYGNPYVAGTHGSRAMVIAKFEEFVLPDLDVFDLKGRDLLCHCVPEPCHCEPIFLKANGYEWRSGHIRPTGLRTDPL